MKYVITALFALTTLCSVFADEGSDSQDNLEALQADVEHSLIAPCCWNMTVDQHDSPKARAVREEVAELIAAGKSKQEILDYFVAQPQYGERILASPSQKTLLGKMAYWLIPVAFLVGLVVVVRTISSLSKPKEEASSETASAATGTRAGSYDDRVEQELKQIES